MTGHAPSGAGAGRPRRVALTRAQVRNAVRKVRLTPAVEELAGRLVDRLAEDGSVVTKELHGALFPVATTKSASAQLSKLLKTLVEAAEKAGVVLAFEYEGSKQAGAGSRRLRFFGPPPARRADLEALEADGDRLVEGQRSTPMVAERRVVVVTFNDHEFNAVRDAFRPGPDVRAILVGKTHCFPLGTHGGLDVLLCHSGQGNRNSQRTVTEVCADLSPYAVVAVGIAFGADEGRQRLGDVLISTFVCDYETAKVHPDGTVTLRGGQPRASKRWIDALRSLQQEGEGVHGPGWPPMRFGGLLSGEKLVDSLEYRERLKRLASQRDDVVGGEMEAAGLSHALEGRGVDWVVIKAVCDFADGRKGVDKEARQKEAAANAAQVFRAVLESGLLGYGPGPAPGRGRGSRRARRPIYDCDEGALVGGQKGRGVDLHTSAALEGVSGGREGGPSAVALDDILAWATAGGEAAPLYALLGEYGMGKTTTCQRACRELERRRAADGVGGAGPVPLYFDLRKVQVQRAGKVPTLREAIEDCLAHGYLHEGGEAPRYEDVWGDIARGAVVFFDGLDEVLAHLTDAQASAFTANLLRVIPEARQAGAPEPRVLVSCRTQYFRTLREQNGHFTGEHRGAAPASAYRAMLLLPFEDGQIRDYLTNALPDSDPDALLGMIGEVHNLRELAQRPFTLKLVAGFIPLLERWRAEGRRVTGATLYREVAREWLIRDKAKQSFRPEDKERLAADFAAHLWREGARGLGARDMELWLGRWIAGEDPHAEFRGLPRDLLYEDFRNSTFLRRVDGAGRDESRFEFAHTSLQEFFLADYLLRALELGGAALAEGHRRWALARPSDETLDFLGQMLMEDGRPLAALGAWRGAYLEGASELHLAYAVRAWERGWPMPVTEGMDLRGARLEEWRIGHDDGRPADGAALLDLRGARLEGARLRRTKWWRVDLRGARFDDALLAQSEFVHCRLEGTGWEGCETGGCVFHPVGTRPDSLTTVGNAAVGARITLTTGHTGFINACMLSPDGVFALSGSDDGTVRVWNVKTGMLARVFYGHTGWVRSCVFSSDGTRVLSGSVDGTVRLWDVESGEVVRVFEGHASGVNACLFSPDGNHVLSGSDDETVRLWDVKTGAVVRVFDGCGGCVNACAFSSDGSYILSGSDDGVLRFRKVKTGELVRVLDGHASWINACAVSVDEKHVISGGADGMVRLWDILKGEIVRVLEGHADGVTACVFSPDGKRVLSGSNDGTICLWEVATGKAVRVFRGHEGGVNACVFSRDGRHVLSAGDDDVLLLWEVETAEVWRVFGCQVRGLDTCVFSPDGERMLSTSGFDKFVRLWNVRTGKMMSMFDAHLGGVSSGLFSPNGTLVLSGGWDQTVRLSSADTGNELRVFEGHEGAVRACAFSPDANRILSGSEDGTMRMWEVRTGEVVRVFEGHEKGVQACAFSPNASSVLSAGKGGTVRLWDAATGRTIRAFGDSLGSGVACAFSPDGGHLLSTGGWDGKLSLWHLGTGKLVKTFRGHVGWVTACAFSPDGRCVLSGGIDGTVRLWDAGTGEALRVFVGNSAWVTACGFSPHRGHVLSGGHEGLARIWEIETGRVLGVFLHSDGSAASWTGDGRRLLYANERAWRYLRWRSEGPGGAVRLWPLECAPEGMGVAFDEGDARAG